MLGMIGLAFVAGILSTLSPCVVPLLPLVLGAAVSEHRFGPVALAGGLALSFTAVGLFVATIGFAIGLDAGVFRMAAAIVLVAVGFVLVMPRLQVGIAVAAGPVSNWAEERFGGFSARDCGASSRSACSSASSGRPASARPSAPPPSWPRAGKTSARSR